MAGPNRGQGALSASHGKILARGQLNASETKVYTVPSNKSAEVKSASVTNVTGGAVVVSLSVCKSGDTAGATNRVLITKSIAATTELSLSTLLQGVQLDDGDFISMLAASAASINYTITGVEFG